MNILQQCIDHIQYSNIQLHIGSYSYHGVFTTDSKLLSKIFEIHTIEQLKKLITHPYTILENTCQISYPDLVIKNTITNELWAVDIKSSYVLDRYKFRGFTLGTYNGYFRNREVTKNIMFPYKSFAKHWCICILYDRNHNLDVVHRFVREKWTIATNQTGSGNTCNIGSTRNIRDLQQSHITPVYFDDEQVFDDFWLNKSIK